MFFQPIRLTIEGDLLNLPEQHPLFDNNRVELKLLHAPPKDFEVINIGEYVIEEMVPENPEAIGSRLMHGRRTIVGIHEFCNSELSFLKISTTYHAISCQKCALRVPIPSIVATYGELRAHLSKTLRRRHF